MKKVSPATAAATMRKPKRIKDQVKVRLMDGDIYAK